MNALLNEISETLSIPLDQIIAKGIKAFLEREIRQAELDIADFRDKYLVASRKELENKIKNKKVYSHPAWEDLIEIQNIEAEIKEIEGDIKTL